jgi:hypothetical protein
MKLCSLTAPSKMRMQPTAKLGPSQCVVRTEHLLGAEMERDTGNTCTRNVTKRHFLGDLRVEGSIILKMNLKETGCEVWNVFMSHTNNDVLFLNPATDIRVSHEF